MTSYQRAGLYVFFDALEADFVSQIRYIIGNEAETFLTSDERAKCVRVLSKRNDGIYNLSDEFDLIYGLDLGEKYAVLMRLKDYMPSAYKQYFTKICRQIEKAIPIRNSTMHGRPLTAEEYVYGFALANDFCRNPAYWPHLSKTFREFNTHPNIFMTRSIRFLDDEYAAETLNNLPVPDYDDTGFVRRPALEAELKKKILGRYPVITVLGDGGNGKTALALQTAYSLLGSRDHTFEVIIWVSAKSNCLTNKEIERIENAITTSIGVFENVADLFEPGDHDPMTRVKTLLKENKVLLFIDNLETVLDGRMLEFASDVPGESKVIFTSRVPLQGGDLPVKVEEFTDVEARHFLTRLASAYSIDHLKKASQKDIQKYVDRLHRKPLLLKWFALGVRAGLDPNRIVANPEVALKFCMENVVNHLSVGAKSVAAALAILPGPVSAAVINHISDLSASEVEMSLIELQRFSLVEWSRSSQTEIIYNVRPFVGSYLKRISQNVSVDPNYILSKYRQLSGIFQTERGQGARDTYNIRSLTVRTLSETLCAKKIRKVIALTLKGDFSDAEEIIKDLKILNSEYFEVRRACAFLAAKQGDLNRAKNEYEAAIDIDGSQPQLYMWFGGFLMRMLQDYDAASIQYDNALRIDEDSPEILFEAARNKMFAHDFPGAQRFLDQIKRSVVTSPRSARIVADTQVQLFRRHAQSLCKSSDFQGALQILSALAAFAGVANRYLR